MKELADSFVKLFLIVWKDLAMDRIPGDWRKAGVLPIFEADKKIQGSKTVPLMSGKVMEQTVLETICKVYKKVVSSSQNGFMEEKHAWQPDSLLQYWALDNWLSAWGESGGCCQSAFIKAFGIDLHNIFPKWWIMTVWTRWWAGELAEPCVQSAVISHMKPSWKVVFTGPGSLQC